VSPLCATNADHAPSIHPDSRFGYSRLPGLGRDGIFGFAARTFCKPQIANALKLDSYFFKASPTRLQVVTQGSYLWRHRSTSQGEHHDLEIFELAKNAGFAV
jgi:hypothetical protein